MGIRRAPSKHGQAYAGLPAYDYDHYSLPAATVAATAAVPYADVRGRPPCRVFKPCEYYGLPNQHVDWPSGAPVYYSTNVLHTLPTSLRQLRQLRVEDAGITHLQVLPTASSAGRAYGAGQSAGRGYAG